jgi:hypothetical protein
MVSTPIGHFNGNFYCGHRFLLASKTRDPASARQLPARTLQKKITIKKW